MHAFTPAIVCFSHLRWNFVFQRPQHVLSRLASERRVYYFEEPLYVDDGGPRCEDEALACGVTVVRPHIPSRLRDSHETHERLVRAYLTKHAVADPIAWYYTPMALAYTQFLRYSMCVYDCMDELAKFAFAPAELNVFEQELFRRAGVVFTGGRSLYYAKRRHHSNVRCFPSAVDAEHFAPRALPEPADLRAVPRPRIGFYGVVDERFDIDYVDAIAQLRPQWNLVIVGPVVKIDPGLLPHRDNIHYIGQRSYGELPAYLHHWDIAMLPFARNDSTRFISPTKTLEYLAAHKPVISTPIADVVDPYGERGLVGIAATAEQFVEFAEAALRETPPARWHAEVDELLTHASWDATVAAMSAEIQRCSIAKALA